VDAAKSGDHECPRAKTRREAGRGGEATRPGKDHLEARGRKRRSGRGGEHPSMEGISGCKRRFPVMRQAEDVVLASSIALARAKAPSAVRRSDRGTRGSVTAIRHGEENAPGAEKVAGPAEANRAS
jgi:hypothetical protein